MSRPKIFVPPISLDRASASPLHRQIRRQIAEVIRSGSVGYASRLPSTRVMARILGVSRNTVLAAYDELAANDLVRGERGSGVRIKAPVRGPLPLHRIVRDSGFPLRALAISDPDGNPIGINY